MNNQKKKQTGMDAEQHCTGHFDGVYQTKKNI